MLDAENKITSIKGFKGAGRMFKEIYQSATSSKSTLDDFMGLVEIPLKVSNQASTRRRFDVVLTLI